MADETNKSKTSRYEYKASIKSDYSDELINTYLIRPLAGIVVRLLFHTPITPNQVTIASTLAGLAAALFYGAGSVVTAGLFVSLKDILDSADGQLARAKNQFSCTGRFLDSLGDVAVNIAIFSAIGITLFEQGGMLFPFLAFFALVGITLRVSYHVFYQVSFLHLQGHYTSNRRIEEMSDEDKQGDLLTLRLQQVFNIVYGWQDRLMLRIDQWCRKGRNDEEFLRQWYGDVTGLRISGLLGFGTELFLLMLCSIAQELELYLMLNVFLMNGILLGGIVYRKYFFKL